jgi:HPt (histidine-containing phosphotransfer) domain-containing protein
MSDPVGATILDPVMLAKLREIGGPALLTRFIETFMGYAPGRMDAAERAAEAGDAATVAGIAHALISSSGQLGAVGLSSLSREVEALASAGDLPGLTARLPAWRAAFDSALVALDRIRSDP